MAHKDNNFTHTAVIWILIGTAATGVVLRLCTHDHGHLIRLRHADSAHVQCNGTGSALSAIVTMLSAVWPDYIKLAIVLGYSVQLNANMDCSVHQVVLIHEHNHISCDNQRALGSAGWTLL